MFKLPDFMRIDPTDLNAESIRRLSTFGKPQEDFIMGAVQQFQNSNIFKEREVARRYFENETDIDKKERYYFNRHKQKVLDDTVTNTKLRHAFYRKLVNQKVNYLLSKPFTIKCRNKEFEQLLKTYFDKKFLRQLQNTVRKTVVTGISWLQVYYDVNGSLMFKRIPDDEVIPFWADADHTVLDAVIRYYIISEYKPNGDEIQHQKVEYYTPEGVWYYEVKETGLVVDPDKTQPTDGHFKVKQKKLNNDGLVLTDDKGDPIYVAEPQSWGRVPFIPIKYNSEELPLLRYVKTLIDDYDFITSDISDQIHDVPNSIRIVKGYDGTDKDEFILNLKQTKMAYVTEDGDVTNLDIPFKLEGAELHLNRLRKDIYEDGSGVDTQQDEMRDISGEALKFKYIDLSLDCNDIGVQVTEALEILTWFIKEHEKTFNTKDYDQENFDIIFNTDMITNEAQTILDCKNSEGIISKSTIVSNHPWVLDSGEELKLMEQDEEAEQQKEIELQTKLAQATYTGGEGNE